MPIFIGGVRLGEPMVAKVTEMERGRVTIKFQGSCINAARVTGTVNIGGLLLSGERVRAIPPNTTVMYYPRSGEPRALKVGDSLSGAVQEHEGRRARSRSRSPVGDERERVIRERRVLRDLRGARKEFLDDVKESDGERRKHLARLEKTHKRELKRAHDTFKYAIERAKDDYKRVTGSDLAYDVPPEPVSATLEAGPTCLTAPPVPADPLLPPRAAEGE